MPTRPRCLRLSLAALSLLLAATAQAQEVYRCGNSYATAPCAGGAAVLVDDARTADQHQQALAAKKQDAQLARPGAAIHSGTTATPQPIMAARVWASVDGTWRSTSRGSATPKA